MDPQTSADGAIESQITQRRPWLVVAAELATLVAEHRNVAASLVEFAA